MLDIKLLIKEFLENIVANQIEIYNEFSLQHELGIFLRERLSKYSVQFERNVSFFLNGESFLKKEIDIVVFNSDKTEKYAIELKCPRNGQYPEQLYSFVKDIKFMEQLAENGFTKTYSVAFVSARPYYFGKTNTGIYKYFRTENVVYGTISKPTGFNKGQDVITLSGSYDILWQDLDTYRKFFVVEIDGGRNKT